MIIINHLFPTERDLELFLFSLKYCSRCKLKKAECCDCTPKDVEMCETYNYHEADNGIQYVSNEPLCHYLRRLGRQLRSKRKL